MPLALLWTLKYGFLFNLNQKQNNHFPLQNRIPHGQFIPFMSNAGVKQQRKIRYNWV